MKCLDNFTDSDLLLLKAYQTRDNESSVMNALPKVLSVPMQDLIEIKRDDAVGLNFLNMRMEINGFQNWEREWRSGGDILIFFYVLIYCY